MIHRATSPFPDAAAGHEPRLETESPAPSLILATAGTLRLRIAELYTPLKVFGGAERQMLEEVRSLQRLGHDVTPLTFEIDGTSDLVNASSNLAVVPIRAGASIPARAVALRRTLREGGFDLLVAHTSIELAWLATRRHGVPYVAYHNHAPFTPFANAVVGSRRYRRALSQVRDTVAGYGEVEMPQSCIHAEVRTALKHRALASAAAVVVPSERTRRELRLLHGVEATVAQGCVPEKLFEHGPPSPVEGVAPPGAPVVLSVSRLTRVKRVDILLRAFARVLRTVPDATLVIVGIGPEEEALRRIVQELGLESVVHFAGFVSDDELPSYHARADVFAAPAMADYAIAPYEALARGCTVVVSDEMELTDEVVRSPRVTVSAPCEADFASAIVAALRRPRGPGPDLSWLTWEARGAAIHELYSRVIAAARSRA